MRKKHGQTTLKMKVLLSRRFDLNLSKKLLRCYIWSIVCVVLKLGHLGEWIRNSWKVSKCFAGEGRKRSVGPIV